MAGVLAIVDVLGETGKFAGLILTVLDRATKKITAQHELRGGLAAAVKAADAHLEGLGKVGIVCDGPRLFRTELPTIKAALREKPHWQKYYDLEREVQRSYKAKCAGLLAVMLTAGLEPEHHEPGLQKNAVIAKVLVKMIERGNEFRRPMQARPEDKEKPDAKKKEERKEKKRKRDESTDARKAVEAEVAADAAEAEAEPVPPPSMFALREILFLSAAAKRVGEDLTTFATSLTSQTTKSKAKITEIPLSNYISTTWIAAASSTLFAKQSTAKSASLFVLPTITDALEACAVLTDMNIEVLLLVGETETKLTVSKSTVIITVYSKLATLSTLIQTDANMLSVIVGEDAEDGSASASYTEALAALTFPKKVLALKGVAGESPLSVPTPPEGSTGVSTIEGVEEMFSKGYLAQDVLTYAYGAKTDLGKVAESLKKVADRRANVRASMALLSYYVLSTTKTGLTSPFEDSQVTVCPQLWEYHLVVARVFHWVDALLDASAKGASEWKLIHEMCAAVLDMPLLPAKSEDQKKDGRLVAGDEVIQTAILSSLAPHLSDPQIDGLADLWAVRHVVASSAPSLECHIPKYGKKRAQFLSIFEPTLAKRLGGFQLGVSLSVIEEETKWGFFKSKYGPLATFLSRCQKTFSAEKQEGVVCVSVLGDVQSMSRPIPLCGRKQEQVLKMEKEAIEELLLILPRGTRPALMSSIGVSIHSWNRFNTRYGRLLGPSLALFLMRQPHAFTVNGTSVKRADAKTSPEYDTGLLKHGAREGGMYFLEIFQNEQRDSFSNE